MAKVKTIQKKQSMVWGSKQIAGMVEAKTIFFNPLVQRPEVWSVEKQSRLIESLMIGYPIGILHATAIPQETDGRGKNKYSVWDGRQRTTTVLHYRNNEFALKGLDGVIALSDGSTCNLNGKKYENLPLELQKVLDEATMTIYIYQNLTLEQEIEMYNRINSGQPVSAVELIRTKSPSNNDFVEMAENILFKRATDANRKASFHYDIIMKGCAILYCDTTDLSGRSLSRAMMDFSITKEQKEEFLQILTLVDDVCNELNDKAGKKARTNLLKKNNLVSFLPIAQQALKDNCTAAELATFAISFFGAGGKASADKEYKDSMMDGSAGKNKVETRLGIIKAHYNNTKKEAAV